MTPLIDGDVLRYEIGSITQTEDGPLPFDYAASVLDDKIKEICLLAGGTSPPVLFFTGKKNFRNEVAVTKPYKGTRKSEKPYHFENLTAYMFNQYHCELVEGLEADDLMAIWQHQSVEFDHPDATVICTRDKDLRMVPGWHYGWECGAQREFGPEFVSEETEWIKLTRSGKAQTPKLTGTGMIFFYSQLITGDGVDNIPGIPRCGPVVAYDLLTDEEDERPLWNRVKDLYEEKGLSEEYLREQINLLWMVKELDEEGGPVFWEPPS